MTTTQNSSSARLEQASSWSKVWLVPLVALGIGIWMIYTELSQQGPMINIQFSSAEGLEAGKTRIKTRDVDIGLVKEIRLAKGSKGVLVTARMTQESTPLLTEDASFWVVSPKVSLSGVSGLSTLLSGAYIELAPGSSDQTAKSFRGLDDPPLTPAGSPGMHLTLSSGEEFAFTEGDPIIYKGMSVGKIENVYFNYAERTVYYNAFVHAPYHQLITQNTRFWNISGIQVGLNTEGLTVHTGNLQTLLTNGVTFGIPEGMEAGKVVRRRTFFHIYADYDQASRPQLKQKVEYALLIKDSVKGLDIGAPIEYHGLTVGRVEQVNVALEQNHQPYLARDYRIPVIFSLYPAQLGLTDDDNGRETLKKNMHNWISEGLKASLATGNLLTGKQYIELKYHPGIKSVSVEQIADFTLVPSISGEFSLLTQKLDAILDKLSSLPLEQLSMDISETMQSATTALQKMQGSLSGIDNLIDDVEKKQLIQQLNNTLQTFEKLGGDYGSGSSSHTQLNRSLKRLEQSLSQLQPLLHKLNRQPNSLIFDHNSDETEPKAKGTRE
ncbi:intermembrane transport protein PqiB [Lacimicrobium alkaliphilum]|uniref:Paraquat-inducible protein B n=1 Tax=Lacimicrobium alkaliphilum TaxID=1526571 RepID=A0ABQ1RPI9_9ALTE|nr:intermembrane transport protein PqiB [Lacimicrobium alkaliphilum]GGD74864.1 paraquat-inducible protein B [Lacimicrobium alkaliphilum]